MSGSPGGLAMPCATSMRNPSTPRSSQNRSVFSRSSKTSGFSQLRSGLFGVEQVQVPLAGIAVGLDDPGPRGAAEDRHPVVRRVDAAGPGAVAEDVALALRRCRGSRPARPETTDAAELVWLGTRSIVTFDAQPVGRVRSAGPAPRSRRTAGRRRADPPRRSRCRPSARPSPGSSQIASTPSASR